MKPLDRITIIIGNPISEEVRTERQILTDSPAATKKIFQMAECLKKVGGNPMVLSLGRGKCTNKFSFFPSELQRHRGIPIVYSMFIGLKPISYFLTILGLVHILFRYSRTKERVIIFYNRLPAYSCFLIVAKILRYKLFLDLEDGQVSSHLKYKRVTSQIYTYIFDRFCSDGVILASEKLRSFARQKNSLVYYGVINSSSYVNTWGGSVIRCLFSGSLSVQTGSDTLCRAIEIIGQSYPNYHDMIEFNITGYGESLDKFIEVAKNQNFLRVFVHGRLGLPQYKSLLENSHVGLSLKLVDGPLDKSTFPSKVIEYVENGLLLVSTDISDVKHLFGDSAVIIPNNDPNILVKQLINICDDHERSKFLSMNAFAKIQDICSKEFNGEKLKDFLYGD